MAENLVIVESPAKARTIKKYLGKDFEVLACYGHVRDLVPKEGAVDPNNNFSMRYDVIEKNAKYVDNIIKALKKATNLYLAPDPDREGEAIAWHLCEILKAKKKLKDKTVKRVTFNQITKRAVQEAVANPREIAMDLVNAQQARRALDFLVGFTLSPLLWKKIRRGLSAGRVQSPALRLIVERELEIEKFESQEYWTIHGDCESEKQKFQARLLQYKNEKVEQFSFTNEKDSAKVVETLVAAANGELGVEKVTKRERKRNPAPPFITSTLQQEAARKLSFSAQKTMMVAQQLYEGVNVGEGSEGLITYMRTDSVNMAQEGVDEIRQCIEAQYSKDMLPETPNTYKTKAKNAQEAHEAIRPTSALRLPKDIKHKLTPDQMKLYDLIWKRAMASQMIPAVLDTVSVDLSCGSKENMFRASGSTIKNPGFMSVYKEGLDDKKAQQDDDQQKLLPPLEEGQKIKVENIAGEQHFTEPPPRFSEASLVKALEERGIGRPSTYASIISTLKYREYVEMDKKRFIATDVARVVNRFLTEYFTQYVDYDFTAKLEDDLDEIANGEKQWIPVLEHFWVAFKNLVDETEEKVQRSDVTQEKMDEKCPECGKDLSIRLGRRGRFVGCTDYPACKYTRDLSGEGGGSEPVVVEGRKCPDCDNDLIIRHGKYGKFIGCSTYPDCKHIEPLEKPKDMGVECPKCKKHNILKRKSRYGKIFYSCAGYPDCEYAIWYKPVNSACPTCKWPITMVKSTKRRGVERVCPQKECDFAEPYDDPDEMQ